MINHVPMDVLVGSIALKRFIETRQPPITLDGHIHETIKKPGIWKERIDRTWSFNVTHDRQETAIIKFFSKKPARATCFIY